MYSITKYKELIEILLLNNYSPTINWNKHDSPNTLLLRHDIDFSVEYAYELAKVEESLNIFSTFFFMLSSNMYNIFSKKNRGLIKDIAQMGHKISFHYDPTVYSNLDSFIVEKETFESLFNVEVNIVSIHRPGPFLDNNNLSLFGVDQTYQNKFFKDMKYMSDSGGRDIFPLLDSFLSNTQRKGLHLLIHPIWWMKESESPTETLNFWKNKNLDFITSEIRLNCKTYKE